jgi:TRAP-type C4-dicarboxylate transport system permease small subunit
MDASFRMGRTGITGAAAAIITGWAMLGGLVLVLVIAVNVMTVLLNLVGSSFPGDFELTEMGVALAAFAFLPYCQLTGANVTADIFTARLSRRWIAGLGLLASLIALAFAALMLWRMYDGLIDKKTYDYTTAILQIPIWWAFVPPLLSFVLLAVASVITLIESGRDAAAVGDPNV